MERARRVLPRDGDRLRGTLLAGPADRRLLSEALGADEVAAARARAVDGSLGVPRAAGFSRFEMGATLTGVPLYLARGYHVLERIEVPLPNGTALPIVRMAKTDASREKS